MGSRARPLPPGAATSVDEAQLRRSSLAQLTLDSIGDAVISIDLSGNVTYLNSVAAGLTGWASDEAAGRPHGDVLRIVDATSRAPVVNPLLTAMLGQQSVSLGPNAVMLRRDGREFAIEDTAAPIRDAGGLVIGAVMVFHDVSIARERTARISRLAYHDALTGLPNRALLDERILQSIGWSRRNRKLLGVLFIDVDRFKRLNDTLGHPVGDELLQSIGRQLEGCVRSSDTVSRLGGDEFVVLLTDLGCPNDAATTARKMLASVAEPRSADGRDLCITVSAGIALYPTDGADAAVLLKKADTALLRAKSAGRGTFRFFEPAADTAGHANGSQSPGLPTSAGRQSPGRG